MQTVALLIESGRAYGRGILRGIARYARSHGHWCILHQEWTWDEGLPAWLTKRHSDGIIARIETPEMLKGLRALGVPVVDVRETHRLPDIPVIGTNNRRATELAIEHLMERGFRNLGFCGFGGVEYSVQRRDHFVHLTERRGLKAAIYEDLGRGVSAMRRETQAILREQKLEEWLAALPKPVGLMACNDIRGRQVLNACRSREIAVPEEVAVIGVDNDEVLCELADPPLSSVAPNAEKVGYGAAEILDTMMVTSKASKPSARPTGLLEIDPLGVIMRRSTDVLAFSDPVVSAAARFIRQHAREGITVEDVVDRLAADNQVVSRATLDRRFVQLLGRSSKAHIMRVRLDIARQLLLDTEFPLAKVAGMVGIEHPEYLSVMFKNMTGETPAAFRRRFSKS